MIDKTPRHMVWKVENKWDAVFGQSSVIVLISTLMKHTWMKQLPELIYMKKLPLNPTKSR